MRRRTTFPGPRWFWLTAALFALLSLFFFVWVAVRLGGNGPSDGVDDIGELLAAAVAGIACTVAARRVAPGRAGWGFLAASCFSWAIGEAIWCYYDLVSGVLLPFPSLADVGFLAAVPLAMVGLLNLFTFHGPGAASGAGASMDRILLGLGGFLGIGVLIIGAVYRSDDHAVLQHVVSLAYPLSDVAMVSTLAVAARRGDHRSSLGMVMAGIFAFSVADSSFAYLTAAGIYGSGNALDTGWVAGYFLIALGALWALSQPAPQPNQAAPAMTVRIHGSHAFVPASGAPLSAQESVLLAGETMKPSWFDKTAADRLVHGGCVLLVLADVAISFYDLAQFIEMAT